MLQYLPSCLRSAQYGSWRIFIAITSLICTITFLICIKTINFQQTHPEVGVVTPDYRPAWLVNNPAHFQNANKSGVLRDVRKDRSDMVEFTVMSDYFLDRTNDYTDGEVVDAIEHYFWGMRNGIAMELGALDGSPRTRSMTFQYEKSLSWKRILIEGNPSYRATLRTNSPLSFSVNAAICSTPSTVHYLSSEYTGGIVEFMGLDFMKDYHPAIYNATSPPGNMSSLNFSCIANLHPVECIPMSHVLQKAQVKHVNFFILDVEVRMKLINICTTPHDKSILFVTFYSIGYNLLKKITRYYD